MSFDLTKHWYQRQLSWVSLLLLPFSWLFHLIVMARRGMYRSGILKTHSVPVPVIIVGNIAVGGTGKTPFVIWLVDYLKQQGYRPGIISRGAGGARQTNPYLVKTNDHPCKVGDEALLLANHTNCPLVIGVDRVAAARFLLAQSDCNIIISDDGLQHYALRRDVELVIVDGVRRFGNQQLLPAGPLRESIKRLEGVDAVIVNGEQMQLVPGDLVVVPREGAGPR
ncbi:MAG: tetraacyldisaccharide 4'-kinase, partial [Gammaproteobacteria bacterium]